MSNKQASDAQHLYDARSTQYDDSWHPRFARHIVELARPQPGEKVLDLACGTGLVTFPAAEIVGPVGSVIGIDISGGMLAQAEAKKGQLATTAENIGFHKHSITALDSCEVLKGKKGSFDLIACASALVLLPGPREAIREWVKWLRPGRQSRLIVDVTHIQSQVAGIVFERVGRRLGLPVPYHRLNFQGPEDLRRAMEDAGLEHVEIKAISQMEVPGTDGLEDYLISPEETPRMEKVYDVNDADAIFEQAISGRAYEAFNHPETRSQARHLFKEEWTKLADHNGKVQSFDCVYVGIGHKP